MISCTPIAIFRQRLLNAARAVEEFDHSKDKRDVGMVDMNHYVKECGSPACVLGHYAARRDLQDQYSIRNNSDILDMGVGWSVGYDGSSILEHFGVSYEEAHLLFSGYGCGAEVVFGGGSHPVRPSAVVDYIRKFVDRKYPQWL